MEQVAIFTQQSPKNDNRLETYHHSHFTMLILGRNFHALVHDKIPEAWEDGFENEHERVEATKNSGNSPVSIQLQTKPLILRIRYEIITKIP